MTLKLYINMIGQLDLRDRYSFHLLKIYCNIPPYHKFTQNFYCFVFVWYSLWYLVFIFDFHFQCHLELYPKREIQSNFNFNLRKQYLFTNVKGITFQGNNELCRKHFSKNGQTNGKERASAT